MNVARTPLSNLRAFEAAARLLSFTSAAAELHLSQSAISQQVRHLEERLGLTLFRRLTRRIELTADGRRFYETVRRAIQEIDGVVAELQGEAEQGKVTLSVGSSFAANWLIPRLADFAASHPNIDLSIIPSDSLIDLAQEDSIDIGVRFAQNEAEGLIVKNLGLEPVFVVCSPSLLEGRAPPQDLRDLAAFQLLHNTVSEREANAAGDWGNWLERLGYRDALDCRLGRRLERSDLLVQAAVHGHGMALVWATMVVNELRDGRLVKVFNGRHETSESYYACCTVKAYAKPKVRAVVEWLASFA